MENAQPEQRIASSGSWRNLTFSDRQKHKLHSLVVVILIKQVVKEPALFNFINTVKRPNFGH